MIRIGKAGRDNFTSVLTRISWSAKPLDRFRNEEAKQIVLYINVYIFN